MKFPLFSAIYLGVALMGAETPAFAQPAPTPAATATVGKTGPILKFATNDYDFGKVNMGEKVKYTFIVTNTGDETLVISKVTPGCHCTTPGHWSDKIEPGQTGEIPLQFDSSGIHGPVSRNVMVASNDKRAPNQVITLHGVVWRAIEVEPQFAYLNIPPDAISETTATVHITSQMDQPVKISNPTSANDSFKAELKEIRPGKQYDLIIHAIPPLHQGSTGGAITVKTSLTNMPELNVTVMAMLQPAISVAPTQIVIPPEILAPVTNIVNLTANGSKPLVLTEPKACCDPRITAELREFSPGRSYQLVVVFPAGYHAAAAPQAEVTVKSNNSQDPLITVPIRQYPRQQLQAAPLAHPRAMNQIAPPTPPVAHP